MGMNVGSAGGKKRPMADINVTPMVDVMLVLLVIFMIAAPSIKQIEGLEVNLPQLTESAADTILTEDARTLAITVEGVVVRPGSKRLDDHYETMALLIEDLKLYKEDCAKTQKKPVIVIAGDQNTPYQKIMQVWNAVKSAGIRQVCFQVESAGTGEKKQP
ncbi:MAG: biopolymer transporter ExbD [Planctomycetota bacterium]